MSVTIKDIARMCNCSTAMVSRTLNGKPGVRSDKSQAITDLANRLGYRPNPVAASLRLQKTNTVGLIASTMQNHSYVEFLRQAERYCRNKGYNLIVADSDLSIENERENVRTMINHQVEGLIAYPIAEISESRDLDHFFELRKRKIPFVLMGNLEGYGFDCVYSDNLGAGKRLARYFLAQGHRRFFLVGYQANVLSAQERASGIRIELMEFQAAHPKAGVSIREGAIQDTDLQERLLEAVHGSTPVTAILAISSKMALKIQRILQLAGISIPVDVSIAGFDDLDWCEFVHPSMTVMAHRHDELSNRVFELLDKRQSDPNAPAGSASVALDLIERESVIRIS